jgi:hypothetical protein
MLAVDDWAFRRGGGDVGVPELLSFVAGVWRDLAAVRAKLMLDVS